MISYLQGKIQDKRKSSITVLTASGVGYDVALTPLEAVQYSIGQEVSLHTYLKVSDSALDLYGFAKPEERAFFMLLMTVSGIGPKTAMNILSLGSIDQIQGAIGRGDVKYLTAVAGLGKKTAERLVVELKSKIINHKSEISGGESDVMVEVMDALESMGYSREEAKQAIEKVDPTAKTVEQLLPLALRQLSRS